MDKRVGIIGGSGLYQIEELENKHFEEVSTPFGVPSDAFLVGDIGGRGVVFLPRHGRGHRILPSEINYKANVWAMKKLGVEWIVSVSAVGSFRKELRPMDIVLVDQFFDRTKDGDASTFFGNGIAGHIMFAHPVCAALQDRVQAAAEQACPDVTLHRGGTYLNMTGPAFSTRAESLVYKSWGMDVIGMTNLYEARLAREAEICYVTLAMVTDYDCWIEGEKEEPVSVEMIIQNLNKNVAAARKIITALVPEIPEERRCECAHALDTAVITRSDAVSEDAYKKLELILGRVIRR